MSGHQDAAELDLVQQMCFAPKTTFQICRGLKKVPRSEDRRLSPEISNSGTPTVGRREGAAKCKSRFCIELDLEYVFDKRELQGTDQIFVLVDKVISFMS